MHGMWGGFDRMVRRTVALLWPVISTVLFVAAFIALRHELRFIHYHQILVQIDHASPASILLAAAFTLINFFAVGGYELLGFRYIKSALAPAKILVTSMMTVSFSNTVGFSSVSASTVRNRIYSQEGLSTLDIAKLKVVTDGITFWLGAGAVAGLILLANAAAWAKTLHLTPAVPVVMGILCFGLVVTYLFIAALAKRPVRIGAWEFVLPGPLLTAALLGLACLDWASFGTALYVLLPWGTIGYPSFMAAFVAGQMAGFASRIPGGIGIFETVFLFLLRNFPLSPLVSALVIFRGVFYLLPLAASVLLLGIYERGERREKRGGWLLP